MAWLQHVLLQPNEDVLAGAARWELALQVRTNDFQDETAAEGSNSVMQRNPAHEHRNVFDGGGLGDLPVSGYADPIVVG